MVSAHFLCRVRKQSEHQPGQLKDAGWLLLLTLSRLYPGSLTAPLLAPPQLLLSLPSQGGIADGPWGVRDPSMGPNAGGAVEAEQLSAQLPWDHRLFHQQPRQPSGPFPRRQLPGSKRMVLPALPEASWLPHLEAGRFTFHLATKVLPACPVNMGQELGFCDPKPNAEGPLEVAQCRKTLGGSPTPTSFALSLYTVPYSHSEAWALQGTGGWHLDTFAA